MIRLEANGALAWLRLDRAAKRNAMTQAMWEAVPPLVAQALDGGARVLLLASAAPGIFCAGADIAEFGAMAGDPAWRRANRLAIRATQRALAGCPIPTIAVVDGDCVGGGCGMAMACDLRVAAPSARFGITPAKLGLVYPLHDVALLVGLVGPAQAKRILFTGALLDAAEAQRIGLVDQLAEAPEAAAGTLAHDIAANAPSSNRGNKALVARVLAGDIDDDAASAALFEAAFDGPDFAEGLAAFRARRPPRF